MACIKCVSRSALVALAPDEPYFAAGTMAGAVDLSFSSSANLEIFELNFQSDDRDIPVVGECPSSERFNRLSWSKAIPDSEEFGLGLIAGGLVDGSVDLWNPRNLIGSATNENALIVHLPRHNGPVRGLEFNTSTPNLLASGADEGEICICDLTAPATPNRFPPLKGSGSAALGEISFLSWHSTVKQILASTSYNGTTVVWDLRKQKPVISFSDKVKRRCSVLQWNPDHATQLVVATDDDDCSSIKLWDMRNVVTPVKEFVGHNKGVIAMSWCPNDSIYLLSCAKDNRTICWDTISGEIVYELPAGTNWNFDVHWYPKIPRVISASSFDGKIGLYNMESCTRYGVGNNGFGSRTLRAPNWYKRPVGVSFGFGGKLVSFCTVLSGSGASTGVSEVHVHNLVTEHTLVSRSSEFEAEIRNGEKSLLWSLCDRKLTESEFENDRETWGILKVMFEKDGTARTKLLAHFGFCLPMEEKDTVSDVTSLQINALGIDDKVEEKVRGVDSSAFPSDNGEDFFNNLPSPKAETPVHTTSSNFVAGASDRDDELMQQELDADNESAESLFDDAIQRALVAGDYKGAVAHCISANKMADALVIAHVSNSSLWETTRDHYLKTSHSPYLKVVSALVSSDFTSLVNTRSLKSWKETLVILCTFSRPEEWTVLCDTLAMRLMSVGNTLAATLCYICAGNIDKTVEIWSLGLTTGHNGKSYVDLLQDLMEKTIVLALATGQKQFSPSLYKLVEKYAEILASQGLLTTAMEYLKLLSSDDLSPELLILRERIAMSIEPEPTTMAFEKAQPQPGNIYSYDQSSYDASVPSQHYYQEPISSQNQRTQPGNLYAENYQQAFASQYSSGYNTSTQYQHPQQPQMFIPTQTFAPATMPNTALPSAPVTTQQAVRPFMPATPHGLKNVEQYQSPTLAAHLGSNSIYQPPVSNPVVPTASHLGPTNIQSMPPAPPNRFMPVTNSAIQRPGVSGSIQPRSPTHQASTQPAPQAPPPPPPTVQTADTSNVPAHQRAVIATLTRLFNETSEAFGGARASGNRRREIEDNSKKLGSLFARLNTGDISDNAAEKLVQLCQALDRADFPAALQIQVLLTTREWDECNFWLATLKRMIKGRQNMRQS